MASGSSPDRVTLVASNVIASTTKWYSTTTSTSTIMSFVASTGSLSTDSRPSSATEYHDSNTFGTSPDSKVPIIFGLVFGICFALAVLLAIMSPRISAYIKFGRHRSGASDPHPEAGMELETGPMSGTTSRARLRYLLERRRNASTPAHAYGSSSELEQGGTTGSDATLPKYSASADVDQVISAPLPTHVIDGWRDSRSKNHCRF